MQTKDVGHELYEASRRNDIQTVKRLIEHGANVNWADSDGDTALMKAACKGFTGIVKILLDAGADVIAQNNYGWTALIYASLEGWFETVNVLLITETGTKGEERCLRRSL